VGWIKSEIEKHSIANVHLLGRHPLEMMPALFKKADALLVSLKDSPTFSLTVPAKVQAYMASSKIILGMFNGEGQQLINESGSGYAVNAGDFQALSQKARVIKGLTREQRIQMENNSRHYYETNFSKEQLFDFLEKDFSQ
jgi:glycosyltransferase involved in cell wall biosynthesis